MVDNLKKLNWGRVIIEKKPKPFDGEKWMFDNGAYSYFINDQDFNESQYLKRLEKTIGVKGCDFGVVPDKVAEGDHSLEFSLEWLTRLPKDRKWYLVVQNGMSKDKVEQALEKFDGLFLGGTDEFKKTAFIWSSLAHKHNKKAHYGRAGTFNKVNHAIDSNYDSLDSSFPLWTMERFYTFIRFFDCIEQQGLLFNVI